MHPSLVPYPPITCSPVTSLNPKPSACASCMTTFVQHNTLMFYIITPQILRNKNNHAVKHNWRTKCKSLQYSFSWQLFYGSLALFHFTVSSSGLLVSMTFYSRVQKQTSYNTVFQVSSRGDANRWDISPFLVSVTWKQQLKCVLILADTREVVSLVSIGLLAQVSLDLVQHFLTLSLIQNGGDCGKLL